MSNIVELGEGPMKSKQAYGAQGTAGGYANLPYSPALRAGDFVFLSGQVPVNEAGEIVAGGIAPQTRQVMDNIGRLLALAGCSFEDVVRATIFLADARDFPAFNAVYKTYLGAVAPARTTVRADLMLDAKVEIDVTAYKPL
jgi:reactive intermediate/imine deaminase